MNRGMIPRLLAVLALVLVFLFSGWQAYCILSEHRQGEESYEALTQEYVSEKLPEPPAEETSAGPTVPAETEPAETEPTETAPIAVDFEALLAECDDVVGWLYCPDTVVNYPVVQAEDNGYYLHRLTNGARNSNGSIFMDYRCAGDFSDWNSILYGHNMKSKAMFGTLAFYKMQSYYDAHPVWYLLTPTQDYRIDLIGGYTTPSTAQETYGIPADQQERDVLIENARQNTTFQAEAEIRDGERLITLSTCAYEFDGARYVLVGVLRKLAPLSK